MRSVPIPAPSLGSTSSRRSPGGRASLVWLVLLPVVAACAGDRAASPTAPASPRLAVAQEDGTVVAVLTRAEPLSGDLAGSADIGPSGGSFRIRGAGLTVTVPRGAVSRTVHFTATARAGSLVAYEMGPHMTFARPVVLTQDLRKTNFFRLAGDALLSGGYVADLATLDAGGETAVAHEVLPVEVDLSTAKLRLAVAHFSGYVIATGIKSQK